MFLQLISLQFCKEIMGQKYFEQIFFLKNFKILTLGMFTNHTVVV